MAGSDQNAPASPGIPAPAEVPLGPPGTEGDSGGSTLWTQIWRFFLTGVLSAIVDFSLLNLLMYAGLPFWAAKALSFIAGTTTAYLINRRWTFRAEPSRKRFIAVVILYALTFALQVGLSTLLHWWINANGGGTIEDPATLELVARTVGFVIGQGVATVVNFIVQRVWIFTID
ncbi:GtrA family protein [Parenemella sanctibonifatiensis]|uniref:GtrA/DPMS transmembrane domain-containing protein n=1 Tax=Parenemella sanctibonifatiensis TaxID=2016505 RepID=A0A255EIB9_9ACTN|nr:GtrA family protein [Parenemella sanctibonifatiensis]OYN87883.1 hypothetical protein CGZ92_06385 [Parenemella sanctibonifatiensis]